MFKSVFKNRTFVLSLLLMLAAELSSFFASFFPEFNATAFFTVAAIVFLVSLVKLEYGLYVLLAELFLGSKGRFFYFDFGPADVSLRMALFAAVFGAWLIKLLADKNFRVLAAAKLKNSEFTFPCILLSAAISWGVLKGILNGNGLSNIFLDANGWLFFGLAFVFLTVIVSREQIENILRILAAALVVLGLKGLILLEFFSHNINMATPFLYRWSSVFGLSEITRMANNFYRLFSQAQIYSLAGFFIFLALLIQNFRIRPAAGKVSNFSAVDDLPQPLLGKEGRRRAVLLPLARGGQGGVECENYPIFFLALIFSSLALLISFSRSFWLGAFGASLVLFWELKFVFKYPWPKIFKWIFVLAVIVVLEIGAVYVLINYPKPRGEPVSFTALLGERLVKSGSEKASLSRFNLLPPLLDKIFVSPVLGSGFGATVSYKSLDPRNVGDSPDDLYTTYAFEWGYLDTWLKLGLAGAAAYLFLIWKIWKRGWDIVKFSIFNFSRSSRDPAAAGQFSMDGALALGMLAGLAAILVTHITSPYLNHPLGIGYVLLCAVVFEVLNKE